MGEARWKEFSANQEYPGMLSDCAIVIWVMSIGLDDVPKISLFPEVSISNAMGWAEDNGVIVGKENWGESLATYQDVIIEWINASTAVQLALESVADGEGSSEVSEEMDALGES